MKILVGQNHLHTLGGTETFTYALVKYLLRYNHKVDVITLKEGIMSERIKKDFPQVNVNKLRKRYDLALVNHTSIVEAVRQSNYKCSVGTLIQTCHGIVPALEQPHIAADYHVSISREVSDHLKAQNFNSDIIYNGIDLETFTFDFVPSVKPENIVSLSQSHEANHILSKVAEKLGAKSFVTFNKNYNPSFGIEKYLRDADLVFGLGRSAFEAMASGANVFIWDCREYNGNKGDGFINDENFHELMTNNASGRRYNKRYDCDTIVQEVLKGYEATESIMNRYLAERYLNMDIQVEKYLDLYERLENSF